ncbi:gypsy/ty3 retroelement polyprotein [Tanacetum coccineum]
MFKFLERFSPVFEDPMAEIKNLRQDLSVQVYHDAFDELYNKLEVTESHAIRGSEMVLGVQWLVTLGNVKWNFQQLTMEFKCEGRKMDLRGTQRLLAQWVTNQESNKILTGTTTQLSSMALCVYPVSFMNIVPTELQPQRAHDHRIPLKEGSQPVNIRPYRHPSCQKDAIETMVKELLDTWVIRTSNSSFASPIVMDKFPIPTIEELINELHKAAIFSKLDLRSGYHQIRMVDSDIHKTTFKSHHGHYEFLVMPFGLTNAPSTFQALMNEVFEPYLRKFVLVFFDDILVYSPDLATHEIHFQLVLSTMRRHQLYARLSKCVFATSQVEYLGHVLSRMGVATDATKIAAMEQ